MSVHFLQSYVNFQILNKLLLTDTLNFKSKRKFPGFPSFWFQYKGQSRNFRNLGNFARLYKLWMIQRRKNSMVYKICFGEISSKINFKMNILHIIDLATTFFQINSWQSKINAISRYNISLSKRFLAHVPLLILKLILGGDIPLNRRCSASICNLCPNLKSLLPRFVISASIWNHFAPIWNPSPDLKSVKLPLFVISLALNFNL